MIALTILPKDATTKQILNALDRDGAANTSGSGRIGVNVDYSLAWLRQEENQFLSCPPELVKDMAPELQELLGYTMGSIACGYFSENKPAGEAKEVCAPEYAIGREPRKGMTSSIASSLLGK